MRERKKKLVFCRIVHSPHGIFLFFHTFSLQYNYENPLNLLFKSQNSVFSFVKIFCFKFKKKEKKILILLLTKKMFNSTYLKANQK